MKPLTMTEAEDAKMHAFADHLRATTDYDGPHIIAMAEIDALRAELARVTAERDEARRWAETHIKLTCAFCGAEYPAEGASAMLLDEHVRVCAAHPMREVEAERDAARADLAEAVALLREAGKRIELRAGVDGEPTGRIENLMHHAEKAGAKPWRDTRAALAIRAYLARVDAEKGESDAHE